MKKLYVKIGGISCDHCRKKITLELLKLNGVEKAFVDGNIACIECCDAIDVSKIVNSINDLGYITNFNLVATDKKQLEFGLRLFQFILIFLFIILLSYGLDKLFGFNIFSAIPTIDSNITYGMLFLIGVLTSIHCISMCGAINLLACYSTDRNEIFRRPFLYNLGRVISYSVIGGIVGLIGSVISINYMVNGIVMIIASIFMLLMALEMMGIIRLKIPRFKGYKTKSNNPFIIGLINGLMPCGPLQAMQVYALGTGSFVSGFLAMGLFALGTVPLMFFVGTIFNYFKGRMRVVFNKVATVLIIILSFNMLFRGFGTIGVNINSSNDYSNYVASTIYGDYQEVKISLTYDSYDNIVIQKGIKTKLIVDVDKTYLTGCNNEIFIEKYNIKHKLVEGKNIIEFMPNEVGTFSMNCWMNMIQNTIKVIDNKSYFEVMV